MPVPFKQSSIKISARERKIMNMGYYEPRERQENEALPPSRNMFDQPTYSPGRDNTDCRGLGTARS